MHPEPSVSTRPHDLSRASIGFHRRKPVRWLDPGLLVGTAVRVVLAYLLGGYLDKRELQAALPASTYDHTGNGSGDVWLDYTADMGDGFNGTYTVAHQLAQPEIDVSGAGLLPRGRVLVLGGDQVYPTPSAREYEDRWKGPYRAALPEPGPDTPTIYALPGNHDWYDGLTSFLRLFGQGDRIGGWQTAQSRSYFALRLPHRWWLLAIDTQLDSYLDEPQLEYFLDVARSIGPNDRVIVCVPRPAWVMAEDHPTGYDSVDYFVRTVVEPTGSRIPLILTGDFHHYARYATTDDDMARHLVTCGGGGAYRVGTAHLPDEVVVPPPAPTARHPSPSRPYRLAAAYPSKATTRGLDLAVYGRLPWRNRGFVLLLGVVQTLLMLALNTLPPGRWFNAVTGFAVTFVVVGTVAFATLMGTRRPRHWIAGFAHAVPHVALGVVGTWAWTQLPLSDAPSPWNVLLAFVVYMPLIGLLDTWVLCTYLLIARYAGVNVNELYAGLGWENHASFLRLRLGADGSLTIYPVAIDRISRNWRADPDAPPDASWIAPKRPIRARLIEPPITID